MLLPKNASIVSGSSINSIQRQKIKDDVLARVTADFEEFMKKVQELKGSVASE